MNKKTAEVPKLSERLFIIQNEIKNPKKSTKGYNYNYANLESVMELLKPLLEKHRLLLTQEPIFKDSLIGVKTTLVSLDTNEHYSNEFCTEPIKKDCQAVGSLITYYRRYVLLCLFNLTPEDDDGASTLEKPVTATKSQRNWK